MDDKKGILSKIKGYFSGLKKKYDRVDSKNKKKMLLLWIAFAVLCVVVVCVVAIGNGDKNKKDKQVKTTELSPDSEVKGEESTTESNALQENANADVANLVTTYLTAMQNCDFAAMQAIDMNAEGYQDTTAFTNAQAIVESYNNPVIYTKAGPYDGGYVAYAVVEIKFRNINQTCHGMYQYVIRPNADGALMIDTSTDVEVDISNKLATIAGDEDVLALIDSVNKQEQADLAADPALNEFVTGTLNATQATETVN